MNTKFSLTLLACCFLVSTSVAADSARLYWSGHYYQIFDNTKDLTWYQTKVACQGKGAHLATITSAKENDFIYGPLGVSGGGYYYIGATDEVTEGIWKWITGEPWNFEYFNYKEGGDYAFISAYDSHWHATNYSGYDFICEWDGKAVVAVATVNDLNGNGVRENAILYRADGGNSHKVVIRDPVTHQELSALSFGASLTPPLGLVVLNDMNGNGRQEIAVLNASRTVTIKDAKYNGETLQAITFLDANHIPLSIAVRPDQNGNGADEITVVGSNQKAAGKVTIETRDSKTKAVLASDTF